VVCLLPPFLKFSNLNFPFCFSRLEVHVPLLNSPKSFVFKFYGKMTCLPIDYLIWCHTDRCFEGHLVCPQSFIEIALPASAYLIYHLLKDILDLLVRCFCLNARLRVIFCGNLVINYNFHESIPECLINEV
jgi:hypothetical protein